ncbi:MAG: response regulator transcription factor [Anaerolineae bacterium]|nr:response regulator transcription factor [Anaerolineae bacterium]
MPENPVAPVRLLIADDHAVVRAGLRALLEQQPDFAVVAEAESGIEAVRQAVAHQPDIVVMDIRMPGGLSGIEACEQIMDQLPQTKVIILTSYAEDELVMDAVRAGSVGYVLKRVGSSDLVDAIRTVSHGDALIDPTMTKALLEEVRQAAKVKEASAFSELTPQEMRILALMVEGLTNREIAAQLFLGEGTVRNYVGNILSKLQVSNRAEAAVFAVKNHIERHLPGDDDH